MKIAPGPGEHVHDLVVPDELGELKATELHARLQGYLKNQKPERVKGNERLAPSNGSRCAASGSF